MKIPNMENELITEPIHPKICPKPNLTYIKLMLSELVWPRELKDGLK